MADIDQIIAGGAGASSRADFSGLADIPEAYWKGKDRRFTQEGRDLFKDGVPTNPDGSVNFGAMRDALFRHGDIGQGTAMENLDLARQQLKFGQQQSAGIQSFEQGGQPGQQPPIVSPPSTNRSASTSVAPPLNRGGAQAGAGSPRGDQPGSIVGMVSAAGVPDELAGPIIQQVSAMGQIDPNATVPPHLAPRIQQVVQAAIARLKTGGAPASSSPVAPPAQAAPPQMAQQGQPAPGSSAPIQPTPVPTQAITQGQPAPVTNLATTTTASPIPSRIDQGIAIYSGILSNPMSPKNNVDLAKIRLQSLEKSSELTPEQKNYVQAVLQGFKGTMQEHIAQAEADKTHAAESTKSYIKKYDAIQEVGTRAQVDSPQLKLAQTLMSDPNFYSGVGEKYNLVYKRLLSQFGADPDTAVPQEAFRKIISAGILDQIKGLAGTGPVRVAEMNIIKDAAASQDNSPQSNRLLVELHLRMNKRAEAIADMAQSYNNGRLDSGFDRKVSDYDRKNPIIADKEIPDFRAIIKAGAKGGGRSAPPVPNAAQAPDGNWYTPDPARPGKYLKVVQ